MSNVFTISHFYLYPIVNSWNIFLKLKIINFFRKYWKFQPKNRSENQIRRKILIIRRVAPIGFSVKFRWNLSKLNFRQCIFQRTWWRCIFHKKFHFPTDFSQNSVGKSVNIGIRFCSLLTWHNIRKSYPSRIHFLQSSNIQNSKL